MLPRPYTHLTKKSVVKGGDNMVEILETIIKALVILELLAKLILAIFNL